MSNQELREKVILKFEKVEKTYLLEEILQLIELEADDSNVYEINNEQRRLIEIGKKQVEEENTFSNDEVFDEIDSWLSK